MPWMHLENKNKDYNVSVKLISSTIYLQRCTAQHLNVWFNPKLHVIIVINIECITTHVLLNN